MTRILRLQFALFALLLALSAAMLFALSQWGTRVGQDVYAPLLREELRKLFAARKFADAEAMMLHVLDDSPALQPLVIDQALPFMPVMPRLRYALLSKAPTTAAEYLAAARIHFQLADYEQVLRIKLNPDADRVIAWQLAYLQRESSRRLAHPLDAAANNLDVPPGDASLASEIAEMIRASKPPVDSTLDADYRRGFAAETAGNKAEAIALYRQALSSSDPPHLDAARAYIRLAEDL